MKSIFKYIGILTIAAVALASCKKEDSYQPGDPEEANCYGVYFPSQDASGSHTYDPTAAKTITITAARTNSKGAITVPVTVTSNVEGVFEVDPIQFADGQEETTFEVKFPNIKVGENSEFHITVADNQYASKYAEGATSIDCSILCVEWQYFLNPKTGEKALITWTQDWWGETATGYIKYYEVDGVRTCQTETVSHVYNGSAYTGYGFLGTADSPESAVEWTFIWYPDFEDNLGNQLMQLPTQKSGYYSSTYSADVLVFDVWNYYNDVGGNSYDWKTYSAKYSMDGADSSYPVSWYDGNGGFYINPWRYYMLGIGGWAPSVPDVVGIAEGFTRVDYSMEMSAELSSNGVLPVDFVLGADVAKVKFIACEGELTAGQIANQVEKVPTSADAFEVVPATADWDEDDACYYVTANTTLAKSGAYTLIAVALDKDGNVQADASTTCTYVGASDEDQKAHAVQLTCGIGSAEKYPGVNTDNSLEVWAYGSDIVDAKVAVFSKADLASDYEGCVTELLASNSLDEESVAAMSDGGYVAVAKSLLPGTEYYVMVYASNGYLEDVFVSSTSCYTTGDPLPIYQGFTSSDYYSAGAWASQESIVGKTFNCYAVDYYGSTGMREYIGKVTIADSSTADEGPDSSGYKDEYVTVSGLGGAYATKYKFTSNDKIDMDLYAGCLYSCSKTTVDGLFTLHTYASALGKWYSGVTYYAGFIPVLDGYWAFVDVSGYSSYLFTGLRYIYNNSIYAAYYDYLLVDPAKDDNGLAPAAASTISTKNIDAINANLPSAKKSALSSLKDNSNVTVYNNFKRVEGVVCPAQVAKATVKTVHGVRPAKADSRSQAPRKDFKMSL